MSATYQSATAVVVDELMVLADEFATAGQPAVAERLRERAGEVEDSFIESIAAPRHVETATPLGGYL